VRVVGEETRAIHDLLRGLPTRAGIDALSAGMRAQYGWEPPGP
jgi:hypothetical protein